MPGEHDPEPEGPHAESRTVTAGSRLEEASAAMIMIHGRGATAESILSLASEFRVPGVAYLAPQAAGNVWYPFSFLAPVEQNEPYLSSALAAVGRAVDAAESAGIPGEKIFLLGFSQGACLATEWVARNAKRYGGLFALSGGLVGDDSTPRDYRGDLGGMPAFFGCSDVDAHIPARRVEESAETYRQLGATVDLRLYRGMGHAVNQDEISAIVGTLEEALVLPE